MRGSWTANGMICDGDEYAGNVPFLAHLVSRMVVSSVGFALIPFVLRREYTSKAFHPNMKLLILLHCVSTMIAAVGIAVPSALWIYYYGIMPIVNNWKPGEDCPFPGVNGWCPGTYFFIFGGNTATFSISSLAVERTWSTVNARRYENSQTALGFILSALSVVLSLGTIAILLSVPSASYSLCAIVILYALALVLAVDLVVFMGLYFYNIHWRRSRARTIASLSHKYQVEENVSSVLAVLPATFAYLVCTLITCVATPFALFPRDDERVPTPRTYYDLFPLYFVLLPSLSFWRSRTQKVSKSITVSSAKPSAIEQNDQHFRMLNTMLSGPSKPRNQRH